MDKLTEEDVATLVKVFTQRLRALEADAISNGIRAREAQEHLSATGVALCELWRLVRGRGPSIEESVRLPDMVAAMRVFIEDNIQVAQKTATQLAHLHEKFNQVTAAVTVRDVTEHLLTCCPDDCRGISADNVRHLVIEVLRHTNRAFIS